MGFMGSPLKSGDRGHLSGGHPGGNCGRGKIQPETNEYDGQCIRAKAKFYVGIGDPRQLTQYRDVAITCYGQVI